MCSWSHAGLYVGDALLKRGGAHAEVFRNAYGREASALLVEANVETGVTAVPLSKYQHHNIRICRPINLRPVDLATVLDTVISQIGAPYNVGHIVDLLRYFLPVSLIGFGPGPAKLLEEGSELTGDRSQDMICSSQIAMWQWIAGSAGSARVPLSARGSGRRSALNRGRSRVVRSAARAGAAPSRRGSSACAASALGAGGDGTVGVRPRS